MEKIKISYMSPNYSKDPCKSAYLRDEFQQIKDSLHSTNFRNKFDLSYSPAITRSNFAQTLSIEKPVILHLSGHGLKKVGLLFEEDSDTYPLHEKNGFLETLKRFSDQIKIIILNFCQSNEIATILFDMGFTVIGTGEDVDENGSLIFASSFYSSFADGNSLFNAFCMATHEYASITNSLNYLLHTKERKLTLKSILKETGENKKEVESQDTNLVSIDPNLKFPKPPFSHKIIMWGDKHLGSIDENLGKILLDQLYRQILKNPKMNEYGSFFNSPISSTISTWSYECMGSKLHPDIRLNASWSNSHPIILSELDKTAANAYVEKSEATYSTHRKNDLIRSNGAIFLFLNQKLKIESNFELFKELWDDLDSVDQFPIPIIILAYTTDKNESLSKVEIELIFQNWIKSQKKHTKPPLHYLNTVIISNKKSTSLFDAFFELITSIREKDFLL